VHDVAERLASRVLTPVELTEDLAREFEARLADSSTLAFRVAYSVLRQRQDAEDVAQDAFVRAHRAFADLRDRDRFRGWLVRLTFRLALDRRRSDRRRAVRELETTAIAGPRPDELAIEGQRAARLWAAIDALPEKLRLVTVLAAIEGRSVGDVAKLVDAPEGTVKSRLFDARKILSEKLK
jgi:RNA polymerase sigma-70 factor (ECF subfamily)